MCTKEVCQFGDVNADFNALDAVIVGINGQSTSSHEKFYTKHQLNFPLLSDKGAKLSKLLGIKKKFGLNHPTRNFCIQ